MDKKRVFERRGQVTLFIIVALAIVAVILIIFLSPKVPRMFSGELNPQGYMSSCLDKEIEPALEQLSKNGGYSDLSLEGYVMHQGEKYKYLCYTSQNYKTCVIQQPLIISHFGIELTNMLKSKAEGCLRALQEEARNQGWQLDSVPRGFSASVEPEAVVLSFSGSWSARKQETSQVYNSLKISKPSKLYELLSIATSITDFESTFGDSETTLYVQYYPDLSINKVQLSDGTTIYTLRNVITKEEFRFASRSLPWPAGLGG